MSTIWSFDLGKASIGEAVRDVATNEFLHKASLLIPAEFASTKAAAVRRRMWRTRQAHKAREAWLDNVWRAAGLEPLRKREVWRNPATKKWELKHPADERLEREFPAKEDATCYTSCLLRIKLLRGEKLEPWQIYKALYSAIQRRGYDPNIPWKAKENRRREQGHDDMEEEGTQTRAEYFVAELKVMFPAREDCHFPCYFDAVKMGLCDPKHPEILRERINCHAESTRDQVVPRWLVEKEIRLLVEAAGKQLGAIAGKADFLLWGPAQKPYASYDTATRKKYCLREGGVTDWQGVVGQKIPRFDNRIIEKCTLIPRLNVCKIKTDGKNPLPESRVIFEATYLMKLKNIRVQRTSAEQTGLTAKEIQSVFENPKITGFKVTATQWKKLCGKFGVHPLPGYEEVDSPRSGGRSHFCRPALDILKRLILSGQTPPDFHRDELVQLQGNIDPKRGLVPADLKFLLQMGGTWEGVYIPNQKLEAIMQQSADANHAIRQIIGSQNDPIVRHRLEIFHQRLLTLHDQYGVPQKVAIEFIREDFMGKRAALEYRAFLKDREAKRIRAREDAAKTGATERSASLKLELLREQGGICLYSGDGLDATKLHEYEIEHIVPRSKGGPDAVINYVITTHASNKAKAERTPFEWLSTTPAWDAYVQRIRSRGHALRNKKMKLLLNEDAAELAERYTALAETAWISKLSRAILDAFFGWTNGNNAEGVKCVSVINGGLTARIRRKYRLNSILNPDSTDEEEAEKKNRTDDRHHALDAMVINFIPDWTRDAAKEHFFRFPEGIHRESFARNISEVMPHNICQEKPILAETIYGARNDTQGNIIVQRAEVAKLAYKPINPSKSVYDLGYAAKQCKAIRDQHIRRQLLNFINDGPLEQSWREFCATFSIQHKNGLLGSRVKHVLMNIGTTEEYKDLSKDRSGAWRKAKKGHRGQIIYLDGLKPRVRPVYAFESEYTVRRELENSDLKTLGFFWSLCTVKLDSPVEHPSTPLAPGVFILNTIRKDGFVVVTDQSGKISQPISIKKLLAAGLRRIS